jgi:hypothetical protein
VGSRDCQKVGLSTKFSQNHPPPPLPPTHLGAGFFGVSLRHAFLIALEIMRSCIGSYHPLSYHLQPCFQDLKLIGGQRPFFEPQTWVNGALLVKHSSLPVGVLRWFWHVHTPFPDGMADITPILVRTCMYRRRTALPTHETFV